MEILESKLDRSVNFIETLDVGKFESRLVQRTDDYFIVYLSSQSGCNQLCDFCHLTTTKQFKFVNADVKSYIDQAKEVFKYYIELNPFPPNLVHFNFMARGEPLDNLTFLKFNSKLFDNLRSLAYSNQIRTTKFKVSTIFPASSKDLDLYRSFKYSLHEGNVPEFYYSLYSVNEIFRKKWLPKALPYKESLNKLKDWQDKTNLIPKIHFAFIEGENDSEQDMERMALAIYKTKLKVDFNIVRYNPYSELYGKESSEGVITRNITILDDILNTNIKVIPRVGIDVYASCGSFIK